MSILSRLKAAEKILRRAQPERWVSAMQWCTDEPAELRDKFSCPEFDGFPAGYEYPFTLPAERYHWTKDELSAEAERRGVNLITIEYHEMGLDGGALKGVSSLATENEPHEC